MQIKQSSGKRTSGLADLLDYYGLVAPGVLLLESGGFLAAWEMRGPDLSAYSFHEAHALTQRIAHSLHLGPGWTLGCDQMREPHAEYAPPQEWPEAISRLVDEERRAQFLRLDEKAHYRSHYCFSVAYQPPTSNKALDWTFDEKEDEQGQVERDLRLFLTRIQEIDASLQANLKRERHTQVRRLGVHGLPGQEFCDLCQYLRYCVSGENFPFALPMKPALLQYLIAPDDFMPGRSLRLGEKAVRVLAVDGFPEASFAGILRQLDALAFPFRFSQQAQCMSEQEAAQLHLASGRKWQFTRLNLLKSLFNKGQPAPGSEDPFAQKMEAEAQVAESEAKHGQEHFVRYSAKVILLEADPHRLREQTQLVQTVLRQAGFQSRIETVNATAAWIASFPGHAWRERRLSVANTSNLAHLMPLSAPFCGLDHNPSRYLPPETPPHFYAVTTGRTNYKGHLHVGDMGHTAIIGPAGAGKTTLQLFLMLQWLRYPGARVYSFDKERTAYTITKAVSGEYFDLKADHSPQWCPLWHLDTAEDLAWASSYLEMLCIRNGLAMNPLYSNSISRALLDLGRGPRELRSLSDFRDAVDHWDVKEAIQYYTRDSSASSGILDGQRDTMTHSHWCSFEMGGLYAADPKIAAAVQFHLFRHIWKGLDPSVPTLVAVDEFRQQLDHPIAVSNFEKFGIEGRKLNMALLFSIQEAEKLVQSPLKAVISREFHTKIYLPNAKVFAEREAYEFFGLSELDMAYLAHAQPSREYYMTSEEGKRMIDLELGPVALSFIARSGKEDRALVDALMAKNPHRWQEDWLRHWGQPDWADYLHQWRQVKQPQEELLYA